MFTTIDVYYRHSSLVDEVFSVEFYTPAWSGLIRARKRPEFFVSNRTVVANANTR